MSMENKQQAMSQQYINKSNINVQSDGLEKAYEVQDYIQNMD